MLAAQNAAESVNAVLLFCGEVSKPPITGPVVPVNPTMISLTATLRVLFTGEISEWYTNIK